MRAYLRAHYGLVIALLAYVAVFVAGYAARRPTPRIVTVTEYRDRVVDRVVTVEKPVVQWRDRVIVREVTRPDGTKIETKVDEHSGRETGEKVTTHDATTTTETHTKTTSAPEGRWSVRLLAGLDTGGSVVGGAGVDYRVVGPLTAGAWLTVPVAGAPGRFTAGISLGLRFP